MPPFCCFCRGGDDDLNSNIEDELRYAGLENTLNIKLLLLGSGESGKSTVLKQIKIINKITPTQDELDAVCVSLRRNAIQCIQVLIEQSETFGYALDTPQLKADAEKLKSFDLDELSDVGPETADVVKRLWEAKAIQDAYLRKEEYWILESCEFFCTNYHRFVESDYVPTEEDIIMARVMTVGIIKTELSYPPLSVTVIDVGGQRNERRKWIHCFDNVNGIIFLCNLAGYNTVLFEDSNVNRIAECLSLFKQTVNNPVFEKTPFYLLFNKKDMFEEKARKDPLTVCPCFREYGGSTKDTGEMLQYIEGVFRNQIQSGDPKRLMTFSVAARFKRDIKTCWDDILGDIRQRNKTQIAQAVKKLKSVAVAPSRRK